MCVCVYVEKGKRTKDSGLVDDIFFIIYFISANAFRFPICLYTKAFY